MANVIEIIIKARDEANAKLVALNGTLEKNRKAFQDNYGEVAKYGAVVAAAGVAAAAFVLKNADAVERLDILTKATRLSTTELQVFGNELAKNGQDIQQASVAFQFLQLAIANNGEELAQYGIKSKTVRGALVELGVALDGMADDNDKQALLAKTLGARNLELGESLIGVAQGYDKIAAAAKQKGSIFTEEGLAKMRAVDAAADSAKESWKALGNQLAVALAPTVTWLSGIVDKMAQWSKWSADVRDNFAAMERTKGFQRLTGGFGGGDSGGKGGGGDWGPSASSNLAAPTESQMAGVEKWRDAQTKAAEATAKAAQDLVDFLQAVRQGGLKGGETGTLRGGTGAGPFDPSRLPANDPGTSGGAIMQHYQRIQAATDAFGQRLTSGFAQSFARITQIVTNSNNILVQLFAAVANAIVGTITDMMAKLAAGGILKLIGFAVGGPVGAAIGTVGDRIIAGSSSKPVSGDFGARGGNTYNINTLSPASVLGELTGVTGSFRVGNSRVGELRRALG